MKPIFFTLLLFSVGPTCAYSQGYPPAIAASKMKVPDGFSVKLVAGEPNVTQPILVKFDNRGRLWVIQYLQYPNPAGLKRVKVDRWSRTVYDRVPEPPPRGPRGADRITICADTDGDGRADQFKDFVTGLNLATGLAFGHGGIYILQAPYLLFYPDRNRDDVPDADPDVLLQGFGMEDAQSQANHLTWGPDGWLYGLNGSTTTCNIRGLEFQQGVWRYHPLTKAFELFCEGGGNLFGLTFDTDGNLFYSSNGFDLFYHAIQGAYYRKNFGKHGPLHNLYTYGYFGNVVHKGNTGRPTTGGTVYLGDSYPEPFRHAFIGGDFLSHTCSWWKVQPAGATVTATLGGTLLDSRDTWFCPTDLCLGPDGSMYVCDFHDKRTAHPDPDAQWDRSNGRVYKIEAKGTKPVTGLNLYRLANKELINLLRHRNGWYADQARQILAERRDPHVHDELRRLARQQSDPRLALQGLWALYVSGGWDDAMASDLLRHPYQYVRAWTVRLLGDARKVSPVLSRQLTELAGNDPSLVVRCQLAATAKRLPGTDSLPIVEQLMLRNLDAGDPYLPLLLWWIIEDKAVTDRNAVVRFFTKHASVDNFQIRENYQRLVRRYASEGKRLGYEACLSLLKATPTEREDAILAALSQGLAERSRGLGGVDQGNLFHAVAGVTTPKAKATARYFEPLTPSLKEAMAGLWREKPADPLRIRLALQADIEPANRQLLSLVADEKTKPEHRLGLLMILEEMGKEDCIPVLLKLLDDQPESICAASLNILSRFSNPEIARKVLKLYGRLSASLKSQARDLLLRRPASVRVLLDAVEAKQIPAAEVPIDQLRCIALFGDKELDASVRKHWGNIQPGTPEEKLAVMRRLSNDLRAGAGDARRGKDLFTKHCATCHRLFGEGNTTGPDLTTTSRHDRDWLLATLVDPSSVIRSQYLSYIIVTTNGTLLTGLIAEQDAASITLVDAKNQRTKIQRDHIEQIKESSKSLMPDNLLEPLTPQELRDLFGYLQSDGK